MAVPRTAESRSVDWLDRLALVGSFTCMVHCLALPLIVAALPALSSVLSLPESFHVWVLAFAAPAAAAALWMGRARHRATYPLLLGAIGVALLALGAFAFPEGVAETAVTVCGSLLLAVAHIANWLLRRACHEHTCPADPGLKPSAETSRRQWRDGAPST